jgi:hypothetical protein
VRDVLFISLVVSFGVSNNEEQSDELMNLFITESLHKNLTNSCYLPFFMAVVIFMINTYEQRGSGRFLRGHI